MLAFEKTMLQNETRVLKDMNGKKRKIVKKAKKIAIYACIYIYFDVERKTC